MWPILWMSMVILMRLEISFGRYLFVPMEERINATGTLKEDWCSGEGAFKNIIDVTLYTCGEECMRRRRCKSVLYNTEMKFCRLRDVADVTVASTQGLRKLCLSSDVLTWDFSIIGNCAPRPCDEKSRCYLNKYLIDRCEMTECLRPVIPNGHAASLTSDVGSSTAFFCDEPYTRVGQSYVNTCDANGEWSVPDFACYPRCNFSPTFDNADVTPTSPHVYVVNETMNYNCKTGFHREDTTDNSGIICGENGDWSEPQCVADALT